MKYKLLNEIPPKRFRNLQCDAIPTLFLPIKSKTAASISSTNNNCSKRSQRMQAKNDLESRKQIIEEILSAPSNNTGIEQMESQAVEEEIVKESANRYVRNILYFCYFKLIILT